MLPYVLNIVEKRILTLGRLNYSLPYYVKNVQEDVKDVIDSFAPNIIRKDFVKSVTKRNMVFLVGEEINNVLIVYEWGYNGLLGRKRGMC